jgi:hypothetical protein
MTAERGLRAATFTIEGHENAQNTSPRRGDLSGDPV